MESRLRDDLNRLDDRVGSSRTQPGQARRATGRLARSYHPPARRLRTRAVMGKDRGDLSPQTPQLRQNPGQHTLLAVNLPLLFVARPIGMGPSRVLQLR